MNIQAMMKQAQKLQKEMTETKSKIDEMEFTGKSSIVTVTVNGKKEVTNVKIDSNQFDGDDIEMLEDMIMIAMNDAMKQVDQEIENKMGKYTQGMPGLF
jgi:DNA-binding YbaB/EbfC family protein